MVECLDDRDESIRVRALELTSGMVSKKNMMEIVKKLMLHADQSESTSESIHPAVLHLTVSISDCSVVCMY